jgi:hypothetical protein
LFCGLSLSRRTAKVKISTKDGGLPVLDANTGVEPPNIILQVQKETLLSGKISFRGNLVDKELLFTETSSNSTHVPAISKKFGGDQPLWSGRCLTHRRPPTPDWPVGAEYGLTSLTGRKPENQTTKTGFWSMRHTTRAAHILSFLFFL